MFILYSRVKAKDIGLITTLTALCVGSSYALISLPNINMMDLIVFVTGFVFGAPIGMATGIISWFIYGAINPLGFYTPIWLSTMAGEAVFGFAGGILGRINQKNPGSTTSIFRFRVEMGLWGLILTIIYDLFTNVVYAVSFQIPIVAAIVSGWFIPPWFGILHEASNLFLFSSTVHPLINAIKTIRGGEKV